MTTSSEKARKLVELLNSIEPIEEMIREVLPKTDDPDLIKTTHTVPSPLSWSAEAQQKRVAFVEHAKNINLDFLSGKQQFSNTDSLRGNIENYIGMTQVPTGLIGPLLIYGTQAKGEFFVPMAFSTAAVDGSSHMSTGCRTCGCGVWTALNRSISSIAVSIAGRTSI